MAQFNNITYQASGDVRKILPIKYDLMTLNDPIFQVMPITSVDAGKVIWDVPDSTLGITAGRRPDSPYGVVQRLGANRFSADPGYYGDQLVINEQMANESAEIGSFQGPVDVTALQMRDQDQLIARAFQRLKLVGWTMFCTGKYTTVDSNGQLVMADQAQLTPFTTTISWALPATSTPLADLRNLYERHLGQSVSFGRDARIYLAQPDVNALLANSNPNDLGAKLRVWLGTSQQGTQPMTLADVNSYLLEADLPQIVAWDDNYLDSNNVAQRYIQPGFGVCVGKRLRNEPVAEFVMTRNVEIKYGRPGSKTSLSGFDNLYFDVRMEHGPWRLISLLGFNGAPALYYPGAIVPFRPTGGGSDT